MNQYEVEAFSQALREALVGDLRNIQNLVAQYEGVGFSSNITLYRDEQKNVMVTFDLRPDKTGSVMFYGPDGRFQKVDFDKSCVDIAKRGSAFMASQYGLDYKTWCVPNDTPGEPDLSYDER